ncbi:MAG: hypothetical protein HC822_21005 [Oscillochloris sp.]|nr:hypothetical protein [Oscillochloris sp.]
MRSYTQIHGAVIEPQQQARLWATLARARVLAAIRLPLAEPIDPADLVALLPAVALCRHEAPCAVVPMLYQLGQTVVAPLQALVANRGVPPGGRALAALILGALAESPPQWVDEPATLLTNDLPLPPAQLLRRAYGYGRAPDPLIRN